MGLVTLNEATLREKLARLNCTQQAIETTSSWCCFFHADARRIVLVWEDVFSKSDQPKRLALVYLANDIIQNRWAGAAAQHSQAGAVLPFQCH